MIRSPDILSHYLDFKVYKRTVLHVICLTESYVSILRKAKQKEKEKKNSKFFMQFCLLGQIFIEHTEEYHAEGKTKQEQQ